LAYCTREREDFLLEGEDESIVADLKLR
jgi:hypothetical protein